MISNLIVRFWRAIILRPYYGWRYQRVLAKMDANTQAQQAKIGAAFVPIMKSWADSMSAATGAMAQLSTSAPAKKRNRNI